MPSDKRSCLSNLLSALEPCFCAVAGLLGEGEPSDADSVRNASTKYAGVD